MKYQFCSSFAHHIFNILKQRSVLGYTIDDYQNHLASFDRFCTMNFKNETVLTQKIVFAWCNDSQGNGGANRACIMRAFGKHLILAGEDAYILPPAFFPKKKPGLPYILNDTELKQFFEATDQIPHSKASPLIEYTLPVIFRLQYACGMRPQEARCLQRTDVNFNSGTIYITDGKYYKDRRLAVDLPVMEMCKKYDRIAEIIIPNRTYFFQSPSGGTYTNAWLSGSFRKCWAMSVNVTKQRGCTPYSLRHRYATETLMRWMEEKKDLDVWIPYLSAFMGHKSFTATYYYIHLLPERFAHIDAMRIANIIPEVDEYDEEI